MSYLSKPTTTGKPEYERLKKLFDVAFAAQTDHKIRQTKRKHEEFYFNDVKKTNSEFDHKQIDAISTTYNIPVSTKSGYAIIEQLVAFMTAVKPMPRLVATENVTQDFTEAYTKAFHCVWSESQGDIQTEQSIRDSLTTGVGHWYVRRANFYNEATTNVVVEYKPWKHILVDPECRKANYSDAEYVIIMDIMRKSKAEKTYDITIAENETVDSFTEFADEELSNSFTGYSLRNERKSQYVWIREFFVKEDINLYIGDNGELSDKKPVSKKIPNPRVQELQAEIDQLMQQAEQQMQEADQTTEANIQDMEAPMTGSPVFDQDTVDQGLEAEQMEEKNQELADEDMNESDQQVSALIEELKSTPKQITVYMLIGLHKDEKGKKPTHEVKSYSRMTKRRIKRTLVVGEQIIEKEILPVDVYPIIPLPFAWFNSPNRSFGLMHFIGDIIKAQNKYLSMVMYDIAVNGYRKGFIYEGSVVEPKQLEENWAQPNRLITLKPDPNLPNGGQPMIIEPSPMNQSIQYMLDYFKALIEYITGIHGVMQGDAHEAPKSMGATQAIQSFGTQRVKMYGRNLEIALENLAYVIVCYLQAFAPRDKVLQYFDENGDAQEVELMDSNEDMKFKVRVEIMSSLPTSRQMVSQLIGFIAQTFSDDKMKSLAMEYMLKVQDVPEAREMSEKMSVIGQLEQQMQALQKQLEDSQKMVKQMENNLINKEASLKIKEASAKAEQDIAVKKAVAEAELSQEETKQDVPF